MELFDCIVVGSGPGGTATTDSLCRHTQRPLSIAVVACGSFGRKVFEARTEFSGRPFGLPVTHDFALGGTSNLWHGVTAPFELDDVVGWPVTHDELYQFAKEALELVCSRAAYDFLCSGKLPASSLFDDEYLCEFDLKTFAFRQNVPRLGRVMLNICGANRIALFQEHFVDSISIQMDPLRGEIFHLLCITPTGTIELTSKSVILAAGALVTPQILLKSGFVNGPLFRNTLPNLGRYLSDHPMGSFGQVEFATPFYSPLITDLAVSGVRHRVGFTCKKEAGFLNHNVYIRPSVKRENQISHINKLRKLISHNKLAKLALLVAIEVLKDPSVIKSIYLNKFTIVPPRIRNADFFCVLEQTASPDSRVLMKEPGSPVEFAVHWDIGDQDFQEYFRFFNFVADAFSRSDRGRVTKFYQSPETISFLTSAAHHAGTCRLGASPEDSCVDRNLRVHGTNRLFVSDASVFPRIGNANVTFSIAALAYRCGFRVAQELSS